MTDQITVWLPEGYKKGTIVYDLDNRPWEAIEKLPVGVNIYEVVKVEPEYAEKRIEQGAQVLISHATK